MDDATRKVLDEAEALLRAYYAHQGAGTYTVSAKIKTPVIDEISRLLEFVPGINDERDSIPLLHAIKTIIDREMKRQ